MIKLFIGTDHNGVEFKNKLIELIKDKYEIIDESPINYPTDDYPDFAFKVCKSVLANPKSFGVLICGTGVGMCIAANKVDGIRCALANTKRVSELARSDDDTNVLVMDSIVEIKDALEIISTFVNTPFKTEEKYSRRIKKIIDYENGEYNEL